MLRLSMPMALAALLFMNATSSSGSEEARLLRQPSMSDTHIAFVHAADLWIVERGGGEARRLTTTPAVESDPHFSPDGQQLAFTSDRSGTPAVWVVSSNGGDPTRLTWYPAGSSARGWSPDGGQVLYASSRETAPSGFSRLWTVPVEGGASTLLPSPWGYDGSFSADAGRLAVDRVSRWDVEWRHYRGGQNTALALLNLEDLSEQKIPHEGSMDLQPLWLNDQVYFLSDRDWTMNIWSFDPVSGDLAQVTEFEEVDIKWLGGHGSQLVFERQGWLHSLDPSVGDAEKIEISLVGDFPWAETRWEEVTDSIDSASLSATGKRALFEARGEIFTVPVENGATRNLSRSSGVADRTPVWSPNGDEVAWVSDENGSYELVIADQDGRSEVRRLSIGESKMAWEMTWSPDGKRLAFVDDDVRVRVIEVGSGEIQTVDVGGTNLERGDLGLTWSPDSLWLAYSKSFANRFRRIVVWSVATHKISPLTDAMADSVSPSWDRGGEHLYFLASTDLALASGWANTSSMQADPRYSAYAIVLQAGASSPFEPESDEEEVSDSPSPDEAKDEKPAKGKSKKQAKEDDSSDEGDDEEEVRVVIDLDGIDRRILSLPLPSDRYRSTLAGPKGSVFLAVSLEQGRGVNLKKFALEDEEAVDFVSGISSPSVSADGSKLLYRQGESWSVVGTDDPPSGGDEISVSLRFKLDRRAEWRQMFNEAWRYQRDYFYDPDLHGRDWDAVYDRYAGMLSWVRHRSDLNYLLDQMNGELSVGHSFVFGGDFPETEGSDVGLLGADLEADEGRWRFARIYTYESWNPELEAPLDRPGLKVREGHYLIGLEADEITSDQDPFQFFEGTAGRQTRLQINDKPSVEGAWWVTVVPVRSESSLRQRAWVEDNRRKVDELSDGRIGYVWVPNTSGRGVISFDRYLFAQQDKLGAVIDERFNGGGLLDDYMVDLVTRSLRAAITNEVPGGTSLQLPSGVLGPKVLLINEMAGSGGDYFPWAWRQQNAGPLIGARTWGGLVKSSVHYLLVDGGGLTAPDNAVFDPVQAEWVGENRGIAPDIEVLETALAVSQGRDLQLERGVEELLKQLDQHASPEVLPPDFPRPTEDPTGGSPE